MVSSTKITERRRAMNTAKAGKDAKKARVKAGTPKFPIHLDESTKSGASAKK